MGIEVGTQIEVVLENSLGPDRIAGTFDGWTQHGETSYLILITESSKSYIRQDIIRVIHTYGGE